MHPQVELVKELVHLTFKVQEFDCIFILCKNPQLFALLCCEFARTEISSPYPVGTNFYFPVKDTNKYRKVKIFDTVKMYGETWYEFLLRQGKSQVCHEFKKLSDFESNAILARDQDSNDWIDGNNVPAEYVHAHSGTNFPTVVSQFRSFKEVINEKIDTSTLGKLMGVESVEDLKTKVKFIPENKIDLEKDKNLIWINTIPYNVDNSNIVLLSPTYSRYLESKSDIENLFVRTESAKIVCFDELPYKLSNLIEITSVINPLSIWRVK